jgi:hypothetical protein
VEEERAEAVTLQGAQEEPAAKGPGSPRMCCIAHRMSMCVHAHTPVLTWRNQGHRGEDKLVSTVNL